MTQWYYSDDHRNRLGPVSAEEMASLHRGGQLKPESLVWREGLADWVQWRTVQTEVVPPGTVRAAVFTAPPVEDAGATVMHDLTAPAERLQRPEPSSPYAPPTASVEDLRAPMMDAEVAYMGFLRRLAALLVDGLVMVPIIMAAAFMFSPSEIANAGGSSLAWQFVVTAAWVAYLGLMQARPAGATLGKMVVSIKLVRSNGETVSLGRSLLRALFLQVFSFVTLGLGYFILAIIIPFTARKQSLHDLLFDTVVVDKYAFTSEPERQNPGVNTATIVVLVIWIGLILLTFLLFGVALMALFAAFGNGGV